MRLKKPQKASYATPHVWWEMQMEIPKGEKLTSRDFVTRLAALRPKMVAPFLRNSWGWLVAIPGWNVVNQISCSIYTFLVLNTSSICDQLGSHLGVLSGNGLSTLRGFTIKWNNFSPILCFHMTSPKFKLRNYRSSEFLLSCDTRAP